MNRLQTDLFILNSYCELNIPDFMKYMTDDDVFNNFLEIEEQCVAEFLVYGEVEL